MKYPNKKIIRNFLYKGRRIKIASCMYSEGDGAYHIWVGRKLISVFGFGSVEEAIYEGKYEINNSTYKRKQYV